MSELIQHVRPYIHKSGVGFVAAYEKKGTEALVSKLEQREVEHLFIVESQRGFIEQLEQELAKVNQQRDRWMAHCERLRFAFEEAGGEQYEVYDETPAQSLAEHDAKVIEVALKAYAENLGNAFVGKAEGPLEFFSRYANTLRQQAEVKGADS